MMTLLFGFMCFCAGAACMAFVCAYLLDKVRPQGFVSYRSPQERREVYPWYE